MRISMPWSILNQATWELSFKRQIGTTFLQNFPQVRNGVQKYLPLLPLAIEQLDLRAYDVILFFPHRR